MYCLDKPNLDYCKHQSFLNTYLFKCRIFVDSDVQIQVADIPERVSLSVCKTHANT